MSEFKQTTRKWIIGYFENVGIFKTAVFWLFLAVVLKVFAIMAMLEGALQDKTISLGEYSSAILVCSAILLLALVSMSNYADNIYCYILFDKKVN